MRIKTTREKRILIIKTTIRWILYLLVILICFTFMMSGTFKKPILLIPAAICIAFNTGELQAAFSGTFCGLLIDIACGKLFGYNAFFLAVICTLTSLLFIHYLRPKFFNILAITALSALILSVLDYKFYYDIWNYENAESIFHSITIPVFLYTVISLIPVYIIFWIINKFFMPKRHLSIEEAIKINQE